MLTVQAKIMNKDSANSERMPYELFKSAVCHRVKSLGNLEFVKAALSDGTLLLDSFNGSDKAKEDARRNAIPEFRRHNIMEAEIWDVV